jgi:voltage-gated potassium channel
MSLRQRIKFLLEDTETLSGKFTTLSLIILNFVFVLIYVLETYPISEQLRNLLWS